MKHCAWMLAAIWLSAMVAGCGASGPGGIDQGMLDAIQGYTVVLYQNDQANFAKYMCAADVEVMKRQFVESGAGTDKVDNGTTYDISGIKWKILQRSADGSVIQLGIESGDLKVTFKSGQVSNVMPVPGSAAGIRLKNDNGWKVCLSAPIS